MPDIFISPKTKNKTAVNNIHQPAPIIKISTPGIFSALAHHPAGLTFVNQEKDEQIILFTRSHFITNFPWIVISFIALLIPLLLSSFLQYLNLHLFSIPLSVTIILLGFYYLIVIGFAFYNFLDWFYNIGIVTQKRIIDIDFLHLSYIDMAITQLEEIEDVVYKQKGFFASFFDYGDIIAHTVTSIKGKEDFVFESIPHPTQVVDIISKLLGD
jgi:hypothetical protein